MLNAVTFAYKQQIDQQQIQPVLYLDQIKSGTIAVLLLHMERCDMHHRTKIWIEYNTEQITR